eukprot:6923457-Prorocentrum_lima.AAC.1
MLAPPPHGVIPAAGRFTAGKQEEQAPTKSQWNSDPHWHASGDNLRFASSLSGKEAICLYALAP